MSDLEAKPGEQEVKPEVKPEPKVEDQPEGVMLTKGQYNAVLDALAELEELKTTRGRSQPKDDLDDLVDDVKPRGKTSQDRGKGVEEMSQAELVDYVLNQVSVGVAQPLLVKIESIRLDREIEQITKGDQEHEFYSYRGEIYDIASRNPNLSLKQAFKLAKEQAGEKPKKDGDKKEKSEELRTLPPRAKLVQSEKPGMSRSSSEDKEPETRSDAAKKAWDDMVKSGKIKA